MPLNTPLSIVVAYARTTRVIANQGALPWPRLPADLSRFARLTTPHTVLMGRATFDSDELASQPLPNRRNVVLSRNPCWTPPGGVVRAADWDEALHLSHAAFGGAGYHDGAAFVPPRARQRVDASPLFPTLFVIGGATLYEHAVTLHGCRWIFATEVDGDWEGDRQFPTLDPSVWVRVPPEQCPRQWASGLTFLDRGVSFTFVTYRRIDPSIN